MNEIYEFNGIMGLDDEIKRLEFERDELIKQCMSDSLKRNLNKLSMSFDEISNCIMISLLQRFIKMVKPSKKTKVISCLCKEWSISESDLNLIILLRKLDLLS